MAKFALKDANIAKLALCKVGANRQRIFLLKTGEDGDDQRVAALARLVKEPKKDWRVAYVPVAVPGSEEDQGVFQTGDGDVDVWENDDEIAKAAHSFMHNGQQLVSQHFDHEQAPDVKLVESAVALSDFPVGETTIAKGTWYVGLEFGSEAARKLVDDGEIDAVSVEGFATRVAKEGADYSSATIQDLDWEQLMNDPMAVNLDRFRDPMHPELVECMMWCERRGWATEGQAPPDAPEPMAKAINAAVVHALVKDAALVPNKPGVSNWVERVGGLPKYIADIAGDIWTEKYKSVPGQLSHAIEIAVGVVRNWCHGHGGNVSAKTRAKACEAAASWESKKAAAHAIAKEAWDTGDVADCEECAQSKPIWKRVAKALGIELDDEQLADEDFFVAEDCTEFGVDPDHDDFPTDRDELAKAKLSMAARKKLPKSAFAIPEKAPGHGSYPVHDRAHAANALTRAKGKPEEKRVRSAVCKRHPNLPECKKMAKEGVLDDETGTVEDVELGERVEKLEGRFDSLETKLIGTDEEPGAVAKIAQSVDSLVEKLDKKPAEPKEPEDREAAIAKANSDLDEAIEKHILPIAKRLDEIEEGDSTQPEVNNNGDRVAKEGDSPLAGIIFD